MLQPVLILGGTADAYALAQLLVPRRELRVVSSLAGRTAAPRRPEGEVRIGGFGGASGLATYLRENRIRAVVDATHPFAARMGWNAAEACAVGAVPLMRLERPAWVAGDGDHWDEVAEWSEAVGLLASGSRRVLLAVGRQELEPFAALSRIWFLIRSVETPDPLPRFALAETLLARGPFTVESEKRLLTERRIDTIVCKNSGGSTDAKLEAARALGLRVVMKRRPARPSVPVAANAAAVMAWLDRTLAGRATPPIP